MGMNILYDGFVYKPSVSQLFNLILNLTSNLLNWYVLPKEQSWFWETPSITKSIEILSVKHEPTVSNY